MRSIQHGILILMIGLLSVAWQISTQDEISGRFMPPEDHSLLIIGQDLGAIGGLDDYVDGYVDHIELIPAGLTSYTGLHYLGGLKKLDNWGSGDVSVQLLVDEPRYKNSVLVIGLSLTGIRLSKVTEGNYDDNIAELGEWIQKQKRPVYIRIGYEFDGPWNSYNPDDYVTAFQHIVDSFLELEVTNFATVWQSATWSGGTYMGADWIDWYPGDDYVDWFGMSYFEYHEPTFDARLELSREHGKPTMIAEATPPGYDIAENDGEMVWDEWLENFFTFVHDNEDVIRAIAYINVDWDSQSMWSGWLG
jgi:hypothetical protein